MRRDITSAGYRGTCTRGSTRSTGAQIRRESSNTPQSMSVYTKSDLYAATRHTAKAGKHGKGHGGWRKGRTVSVYDELQHSSEVILSSGWAFRWSPLPSRGRPSRLRNSDTTLAGTPRLPRVEAAARPSETQVTMGGNTGHRSASTRKVKAWSSSPASHGDSASEPARIETTRLSWGAAPSPASPTSPASSADLPDTIIPAMGLAASSCGRVKGRGVARERSEETRVRGRSARVLRGVCVGVDAWCLGATRQGGWQTGSVVSTLCCVARSQFKLGRSRCRREWTFASVPGLLRPTGCAWGPPWLA